MKFFNPRLAMSLVFVQIVTTTLYALAAGPIALPTAQPAHIPQKKLEINLDKAVPLPLPTPKFELKATVFETKDNKNGWVIKIPGGHPIATPAYAEGMIFVGGGYGSHEFYAFDANDGRLVWQFKTGDDGPTAAVVEDGYCAFNTESCTVYVLDAKTGKLVWQEWLGDPLMSQPTIYKSRLYMAYPGGQRGKSATGHRLLCADLKSGKHIWDKPISGDVISAPVADDDRIFATCFDGTSFCFNSSNGSEIWKRQNAGTSAPIINKGQLIVMGKEVRQGVPFEGLMKLSSLHGKDEGTIGRHKKADYLAAGSGNAVAGLPMSVQNSFDSSVGFAAPPPAANMAHAKANVNVSTVIGGWAYQGSRAAYRNGRIMGARGQTIDCYGEDGSTKWEAEAVGKNISNAQQVFSPPSLGRKHLYFGSGQGHLLSVNQDDCKVKFMYATGQPISFQPALANGNLYIGTANGMIICLKTGDKDADGWSSWGGNAQHNKRD